MNIGVVSPWVLTRKALCSLLAIRKDFKVMLEVDSALHHFEPIQQARPDVLLVEVVDPAADLEVVARVRKLFPDTRVLLLLPTTDEEFELRAIRAGAWGSVSKQSDPEVLEKALRAVGQGEIWASHHLATLIITKSIPGKEEDDELTQREWEILALVSSGYQNKEIASRLSISSNTIKAHLSAIYKKLQVRTRLGAALHYFQQARQRPSSELDEAARAPGRLSGRLRRSQTP